MTQGTRRGFAGRIDVILDLDGNVFLRQSVSDHFDGGPCQSGKPSRGRERGRDQIQDNNQLVSATMDADAASKLRILVPRQYVEGRQI